MTHDAGSAEATPRKRWALRLGRFAGIDVYLHATFLLLLGWLASMELVRGAGGAAALLAVGYFVALFGCVVLHELGHALAARRFGIATRDITLYPIGGIARLERMPRDPRQEAIVAIAGPLVNVAIAALLFGVLVALPSARAAGAVASLGVAFVPGLLTANVFLAGFNLLPAFPMDGGRVLRAMLSTRLGEVRATQVAARVGQGMALLFAGLGLFLQPTLLLIAVFVWIGAAHEANASVVRSAIADAAVRRAMETRFQVISALDTLERGYQLVMAGQQVDFPVLAPDGAVVGLLDREALARGLAELGPEALVRQVASPNVLRVRDTESLAGALERLAGTPWRTVLVFDARDVLVGLLTADNVGELVMFATARLARHPERA